MTNKILPASILLIFIVFALIQLNDPDPLLWVSLYALVALCGLVTMVKPLFNLRLWLVGIQIGFVVYGVFLVPGFLEFLRQPDKVELVGQMKAESPWIEETRELLGLLIAVIALQLLKKPTLKNRL